jgi:hypothetical protein
VVKALRYKQVEAVTEIALLYFRIGHYEGGAEIQ